MIGSALPHSWDPCHTCHTQPTSRCVAHLSGCIVTFTAIQGIRSVEFEALMGFNLPSSARMMGPSSRSGAILRANTNTISVPPSRRRTLHCTAAAKSLTGACIVKMAAHASNSCKVTHSNEADASLQEYMSHAGTVQWEGQPHALHQRLRQRAQHRHAGLGLRVMHPVTRDGGSSGLMKPA